MIVLAFAAGTPLLWAYPAIAAVAVRCPIPEAKNNKANKIRPTKKMISICLFLVSLNANHPA